jgi:flagellar protein FliS
MYADEYLESKVMTAPPQQLHLMVLDGAIRHARQAKVALEQQDWENLYASLNQSREFISELISGLNPEAAPEMIESVKLLFLLAFRQLALADMHRDGKALDEAIHILSLHRETWLELMELLPQQSAAASDASPSCDWQG